MMTFIKNINNIAKFLARRDIPALTPESVGVPVDLLVLLGSSLTGSIHLAAEAIHKGVAKKLLVSGGIGHSTQYLRDAVIVEDKFSNIITAGRSEAEIIRDILVKHLGADPDMILTEIISTNCGSNAEESRRLLDQEQIFPSNMIIIQDPTMQRRSQACFERAWRDKPEVEILSFSPFIPIANVDKTVGGDEHPVWSYDRFVSLVLGEIPRLRDDKNGYGPNGKDFYGHVEIPEDVLDSYDECVAESANKVRIIPKNTDVLEST